MTVRIEKDGPVWTIIHDRPEARNAMDPESADALTAAFLAFDADRNAAVAVFYGAGGAFCAGGDLKYVSSINAAYPLGELDISTARPYPPKISRICGSKPRWHFAWARGWPAPGLLLKSR